MEEEAKLTKSVRRRADEIKSFRCKNLIAVLENPTDVRNIGTVIRNVNALGSRLNHSHQMTMAARVTAAAKLAASLS
jgi:tRNA G18 (ribose-2'-O)-methylase SpoU